MSDSALFDQLNLLFLEENEVHFLGLEDVDVAVRKSHLAERAFVLIIVDQHQSLLEKAADAFDLFLSVVLHFCFAFVLGDEIHEVVNLSRQFAGIKHMAEVVAGDPSSHEVHDLVNVDVGVSTSNGLGLHLEVIQKLQA